MTDCLFIPTTFLSLYKQEDRIKMLDLQIEYVQSKIRKETNSLFLVTSDDSVSYDLDQERSEMLQKFLDAIKDVNSEIKIYLTVDNQCSTWNLKGLSHVQDILWIDHFLFFVYYKVICQKLCDYNRNWHPSSQNILILILRATAPQRLGLFYRLVNSPIAGRLKWSLPNAEQYEEYFTYLPEIDDLSGVVDFMMKYQRRLDDIDNWYDGPIPFDPKVYSDVLFQIVSATCFSSGLPKHSHLIEEKGWLPIVNHLPFVLAASEKSSAMLERMGFKTFNKFFKIPNYDDPDSDDYLRLPDGTLISDTLPPNRVHVSRLELDNFSDFYDAVKDNHWPDISSWNEIGKLTSEQYQEIFERLEDIRTESGRLEAVVENTISFAQNIQENAEEIKAMIDHNFQRFIELGEENLNKIENFLVKNNVHLSLTEVCCGLLDLRSFVNMIDEVFSKMGLSRMRGGHNDHSN